MVHLTVTLQCITNTEQVFCSLVAIATTKICDENATWRARFHAGGPLSTACPQHAGMHGQPSPNVSKFALHIIMSHR